MCSGSSSEFPLKYENEESVSDSHQSHCGNLFGAHLHIDNSVPSDSLIEVKIKSEEFGYEDGVNAYPCDFHLSGNERVPLELSKEADILEDISLKSEVIEDDSSHSLHSEQKSHSSSEDVEKCSQGTNFESQGETFTNRECGKSFSPRETLEKENSRFHETRLCDTAKQFSCRECWESFPTLSMLYRHKRGHARKKSLTSRECGQSLSLSETLVKCNRRHRAGKKVKRFACRKCGKSFFEKCNLIRHNMRVHAQIHQRMKTFKCTDCGKAFSLKSNLMTHLKIHPCKKPFECNVCGKGFLMKSSFIIHMRIHTGEKPFKCNDCGKAFSQKHLLTTHNMRYHIEKPCECNVFGEAFSQKIVLTNHMIIHTGEKQFECNDCGKVFFQHPLSEQHLATRTGITMVKELKEKTGGFRCNNCGKVFSQQSLLEQHLRTHSGIAMIKKLKEKKREFRCKECGKVFSTRRLLAKHKKIHSGEVNPSQCNECGKTFHTKWSLRSHMWTHAERKMSPHRTARSSYSKWKIEEKWVLLWAIEYARVKYTNRMEQSKQYQKIFQHHCPNKNGITKKQLTSQNRSTIVQKAFTEEEITNMKNAIKAMVENQKCPLSEPLEVPTTITTPLDQRNANMPPHEQLKPLTCGTSMESEDISPQRFRVEHLVNYKWKREEKWVLLWAIEYARVKYTNQREQSKEYRKIFHHLCPSKQGIPRNNLTAQKNNFIIQEVFTEEEITNMKNAVKAMVKNKICPLSEPLEVPTVCTQVSKGEPRLTDRQTNITIPVVQKKKNMPPHEQMKPLPLGANMEAEGNISPQRLETKLAPPKPVGFLSSSSSLDSERPQKRWKPFQSYNSGKSFPERSAPTNHKKIHSGEMPLLPFSCHECGKTFALKQDIVSHMKIHTKEKPFFCQKCPKTFAYKFSHAVHMRVHSEVKQFYT